MGRRALRPCVVSGCPNLVGRGPCPEHQSARRRREDKRRGSRQSRGYDRQHEQWREAVLSRDNHLCQPCLRVNVVRASNVADHIRPFDQGGARLDPKNGQVICPTCHGFKTAWERDHGPDEPWPEKEAGR